jgi:hypothetical protein
MDGYLFRHFVYQRVHIIGHGSDISKTHKFVADADP